MDYSVEQLIEIGLAQAACVREDGYVLWNKGQKCEYDAKGTLKKRQDDPIKMESSFSFPAAQEDYRDKGERIDDYIRYRNGCWRPISKDPILTQIRIVYKNGLMREEGFPFHVWNTKYTIGRFEAETGDVLVINNGSCRYLINLDPQKFRKQQLQLQKWLYQNQDVEDMDTQKLVFIEGYLKALATTHSPSPSLRTHKLFSLAINCGLPPVFEKPGRGIE